MKTVPLRRVVDTTPGQSPPGEEVTDLVAGSGLPFIQGNAEFTAHSPSPRLQCESAPKRARAGDLLISVRAPVGAMNWCAVDLGIGRGVAAIRPSGDWDRRYVAYGITSRLDELRALATGSTFEAVTAETLGALEVPGAEVVEQRRIADFLDDRVARIDRIVAARREQVASVEAVFAGQVSSQIDECVPSFAPLWLITDRITDGAHVSPESEGGVYDFVSTRDVRPDGTVDFDGSLKTSPASYEALRRQGCQPCAGDVLFSKDGTVGRTSRVTGTHEFVVASSLIIVRPAPHWLDADYLHFAFKHPRVQQSIDSFVKGAGLPRISIANLKRVAVPLLGLRRQEAVARALDRYADEVLRTTATLRRSIALLAEYKSSIITAAVTGELDVTTAGSGIPT